MPILRTILDRLIYNDEYDDIEEALSVSNVGARKGRNVRDNILVLNAITNSIINGKEKSVDIEKCFDALWVEECVNDLYESGFQSDKLPLLFQENQNAMIAVKCFLRKTIKINIKISSFKDLKVTKELNPHIRRKNFDGMNSKKNSCCGPTLFSCWLMGESTNILPP